MSMNVDVIIIGTGIIYATHNPNMSFAADLDLAIVMSGSVTDATVDMTGGQMTKIFAIP